MHHHLGTLQPRGTPPENRAPGSQIAASALLSCCALRAQGLKERLIELMPEKQAALKTLKKEHGKKIVDKVMKEGGNL